MATLTIGGKTVFTQSGTDEPVLSSDITGTLGSGIVFPAGHVIQVVQDSWQGKTSSLSNSSVWTATGLEKDIQISSGNYVLVECVLAVEVITSGTNGLVALASGANNTTVDSSDFIINPWMIQGLSVADNVITAGQYLHTTPQSSVPQRYKVFVKPEAGYAVQYGAQTGAGYFYNTLTLYEIQA
tara:strand:- start:57 stop:608 length:552 start_codon:yes stop_codon:yes gene_type:complete